MANRSLKYRYRKHRKSKHRSKRNGYRGGRHLPNAPNPNSYSSGSSYEMAVVGDGNTQFQNVFGPSNNSQSNVIRGLQGQIGGKRKMKGKSRKGGYWSQVINQAVVPFALWGMQNRYRRNNKTKKH